MKYFYLDPEVPRSLGVGTTYDKEVITWKLEKPEIVFKGWLGGDILTITPCFFVSESLKIRLEKEHFDELSYEKLEVSISPQFKEFYPNRTLPNFYWIKIDGNENENNWFISKDNRLVISDRVVEIINEFDLSMAAVENYKQ